MEDVLGQVDGHCPAFLHRRIRHPVARPAHVAQGSHGGEAGIVIRGAFAHQLGNDILHRRRGNVQVPAARAKGLGEVLRGIGRRAHDNHGALRRLLHRLEQRVGAVIVEAIRVIEDHHAPRGDRGQARGAPNDLAHRIHRDDDLLRVHQDQIRVLLSLQHGAAGLAFSAARFLWIGAHERGREIDCGQGTPRAGRSSKEPGMAHRPRICPRHPPRRPRGTQDSAGHTWGICQSLRNASRIHSL